MWRVRASGFVSGSVVFRKAEDPCNRMRGFKFYSVVSSAKTFIAEWLQTTNKLKINAMSTQSISVAEQSLCTEWLICIARYPRIAARVACQLASRELLLVDCLSSQEHAKAFQGRICSDICTCCHTDMEVADQLCSLTQSQIYWRRPSQSDHSPYKASSLAEQPRQYQCLSHWYGSAGKKTQRGISDKRSPC